MTPTTQHHDRTLAEGEPDCLDVLMAIVPDLDITEGVDGLRAINAALIAGLPAFPIPDGVHVRTVAADGDTPELRIYEPTERRSNGAVLWIHGGGLIDGFPGQDDPACSDIVLTHGCPVISTRYRLAPDHPYPAGLDDCMAALRWCLSPVNGMDLQPGRLVIEGSSAGGGLAAAVALRAKDEDVTGVRALLLEYPMLDDRVNASMERVAFPKTWHASLNRLAWNSYLGERSPIPVEAAPGRATVQELRGLPPTFIDVGVLDGFYDEGVDFAHRLALAEVPVELVTTAQAFHASERLAPDAPSSRRIIDARRTARTRFLADD